MLAYSIRLYIYGTRAENFGCKTGGFDVYTSTDLVNFSEAKECFNSEKYGEDEEFNIESYLPVKNFVTLSLDSSREYIGAIHRQSNKQELVVSSDYSSPGFFKTDIVKGEWKIMLNVHSVSCDVEYKLVIEGEE